MSHDERMSVYNCSTQMFPRQVEKTIKDICTDKIALDFLKTQKDIKALYECSKLSVFHTEYKQGQYVLLPGSTNTRPLFGKIVKLLCCDQGKYSYLYYQKTSHCYCTDTDLFMISSCEQFEIIATDHLPDFHTLEGDRGNG